VILNLFEVQLRSQSGETFGVDVKERLEEVRRLRQQDDSYVQKLFALYVWDYADYSVIK
jgi:hypothetical protein